MLQTIIEKVSVRIGTAVGASLSAYGVAASDLSILLAAIPILLGLMVDIGTRSIYSKRKK